MNTLEATGISVAYNGKRVLDDVSFAAASGELVGLIGANGAGKTTLVRVLAGLKAPDAGTVTLGGLPLGDIETRARARRIAYLPTGAPCHWPVSVARVVALGRLPYATGIHHRDDGGARAVREALAATDIENLAGRDVTSLSSGERVRALLARAIAGEPDFLLADEPTASLDPYHQLHVMELLRRRADNGTSVVAVMHDLSLAARFCHRVVLIQNGRLLADGKPSAVLTPDHIRAAYGVDARFGKFDGDLYLVPWERIGKTKKDFDSGSGNILQGGP